MAVDFHIKMSNNIKGETKSAGRTDEIDVLAWSWGCSNSGSFHIGGGGGTGKVNVQDMSFTKWIDKSSPLLMLKCCDGTHIDKVELTCQKAGGEKPIVYYTIIMTKVMVTSISTGGSGGEDKLTENVTLNFAHAEVKYQEQDDKGKAKGGTVDMKWDIEANKSQ